MKGALKKHHSVMIPVRSILTLYLLKASHKRLEKNQDKKASVSNENQTETCSTSGKAEKRQEDSPKETCVGTDPILQHPTVNPSFIFAPSSLSYAERLLLQKNRLHELPAFSPINVIPSVPTASTTEEEGREIDVSPDWSDKEEIPSAESLYQLSQISLADYKSNMLEVSNTDPVFAVESHADPLTDNARVDVGDATELRLYAESHVEETIK
ncbi:unnamed protein product [Dibothriocephalus latus]|uniref:Uncharacterized protein n=1 Tax=Dibothriocephalus latus TaxID=60516 RepID=A0A3P6THM9_DIBLA|nr:unnamed protein product [Dibothriocephalus latus]